jgi:hypothetical protein
MVLLGLTPDNVRARRSLRPCDHAMFTRAAKVPVGRESTLSLLNCGSPVCGDATDESPATLTPVAENAD